MGINLRTLTYSGTTTKGSILSYKELDDNFISLKNRDITSANTVGDDINFVYEDGSIKSTTISPSVFIPILTDIVASKTILVSYSGSDVTASADSIYRHYRTVNAAHAAANDGDTILICTGEYDINDTLYKQNVSYRTFGVVTLNNNASPMINIGDNGSEIMSSPFIFSGNFNISNGSNAIFLVSSRIDYDINIKCDIIYSNGNEIFTTTNNFFGDADNKVNINLKIGDIITVGTTTIFLALASHYGDINITSNNIPGIIYIYSTQNSYNDVTINIYSTNINYINIFSNGIGNEIFNINGCNINTLTSIVDSYSLSTVSFNIVSNHIGYCDISNVSKLSTIFGNINDLTITNCGNFNLYNQVECLGNWSIVGVSIVVINNMVMSDDCYGSIFIAEDSKIIFKGFNDTQTCVMTIYGTLIINGILYTKPNYGVTGIDGTIIVGVDAKLIIDGKIKSFGGTGEVINYNEYVATNSVTIFKNAVLVFNTPGPNFFYDIGGYKVYKLFTNGTQPTPLAPGTNLLPGFTGSTIVVDNNVQ